jgi:rfaE bifunctional protein kinase chain/domain
MNLKPWQSLLSKFTGKRIVVLGDMMLDEYLYGETTRISREAPVLILKYGHTEVLPGGGANPVSNIHSLGGQALPVGVVGDDAMGARLRAIFADKGMDTSGLVEEPGRVTAVKTRILAGGHNTAKQQVIRVDRIEERPVAAATERRVLTALEERLKGAQGLIVSDYGNGLVTDRVLAHLNGLRRRHPRLVICVDSRYRLMDYRNVTVVTPNETEAAPAAGFEEYSEAMLPAIGKRLLATTRAGMVLVTRGSQGMSLFRKQRPTATIPVCGSREIVDVNGAGDTVAAAITLALASGAEPEAAMALANAAGGVAVMQSGPAAVTAPQVLANLAAHWR